MLKITPEVLDTFKTEQGGFTNSFVKGCQLVTGSPKWGEEILKKELTGSQAKILRELAELSLTKNKKRVDELLLSLELSLSKH